ncbi:barstar family protein [Tersicoccus sp. MR15.9]|uniref:barstar family protein n=1 Tax=Tersicoccus mangrovi TaxID=3121635 RepID=UPI002FE640F7
MEQLTLSQWRRRRHESDTERPDATPPGADPGTRTGRDEAVWSDDVPVREVASGTDRAEALAALARALAFPAHFSGTLDALADSLRDAARTPFTLVWVVDPALPAVDADRITDVLAFVEEEAADGAGDRPERPGARATHGAAATPVAPARPRFRVVVVRP